MLFSHVWKVFNNILISFQKYFKNFKKKFLKAVFTNYYKCHAMNLQELYFRP